MNAPFLKPWTQEQFFAWAGHIEVPVAEFYEGIDFGGDPETPPYKPLNSPRMNPGVSADNGFTDTFGSDSAPRTV